MSATAQDAVPCATFVLFTFLSQHLLVRERHSDLTRTRFPPLPTAAGAQPGDVVTLVPAGTSLAGDAAADAAVPPVKQLKSDDWKTIVAGLAVKGGAACFLGHALHTQGGQVTLPKEMADGAGIH